MSSRNKNNIRAKKVRRPANIVKQVVKEIKKEIKINERKPMPRQRQPRRNNAVRAGTGVGRQISSGMRNGIGRTLAKEPTAANFPKVYMNPFLKIDARLPIWPVRSTLVQMRLDTILTSCNGNGNGYVLFSPANMICNDLGYAYYSNATTPDLMGFSNGPAFCGGAYSADSFQEQGFSMRIVAFGFKIKYTGRNDDSGGFITFQQQCPRDTLENQDSTTIMGYSPDWKQYSFNDKFKQFNRLFTENDDSLYMNRQELQPDQFFWCYDDFGTNNPENYYYIGAYINGAVPSAKFEVQVAAHFELIGPTNNTIGVKATQIDTKSVEKVVNTGAALRSHDNYTPDWAMAGEILGGLLL